MVIVDSDRFPKDITVKLLAVMDYGQHLFLYVCIPCLCLCESPGAVCNGSVVLDENCTKSTLTSTTVNLDWFVDIEVNSWMTAKFLQSLKCSGLSWLPLMFNIQFQQLSE